MLSQEVGKFIRYWGFKKIHGRIWTHLFLSETPLDAGILMKRLNVSKALMSLSLNDLLAYDVIVPSKKSPRGTQTYMANPRVLDVIMNVLRKREGEMLQQIAVATNTFRDMKSEQHTECSICPDKLKSLQLMVNQAQLTLQSILELSQLNWKDWSNLNSPKSVTV